MDYVSRISKRAAVMFAFLLARNFAAKLGQLLPWYSTETFKRQMSNSHFLLFDTVRSVTVDGVSSACVLELNRADIFYIFKSIQNLYATNGCQETRFLV